jgi:ABC-2 type transport system ATP-binding protein
MLGLDVAADRTELHRRIGVVPENYGLYDRLSGRRHVVLATELKTRPPTRTNCSNVSACLR